MVGFRTFMEDESSFTYSSKATFLINLKALTILHNKFRWKVPNIYRPIVQLTFYETLMKFVH
jgi:hypothetical protein